MLLNWYVENSQITVTRCHQTFDVCVCVCVCEILCVCVCVCVFVCVWVRDRDRETLTPKTTRRVFFLKHHKLSELWELLLAYSNCKCLMPMDITVMVVLLQRVGVGALWIQSLIYICNIWISITCFCPISWPAVMRDKNVISVHYVQTVEPSSFLLLMLGMVISTIDVYHFMPS